MGREHGGAAHHVEHDLERDDGVDLAVVDDVGQFLLVEEVVERARRCGRRARWRGGPWARAAGGQDDADVGGWRWPARCGSARNIAQRADEAAPSGVLAAVVGNDSRSCRRRGRAADRIRKSGRLIDRFRR